jgi:hypothetical protein
MRVVPDARELPAGVWLAPRTLNELTVKVAVGGAALRVVEAAGSTTPTLSSAVTSRTASPAATEETRLHFSPMGKR